MPSWHSVQLNNDLVVAYPDIYQVALGSDAEFVVLASDGLWDYMGRSIAWSLESVLAPFFFLFFQRITFTLFLLLQLRSSFFSEGSTTKTRKHSGMHNALYLRPLH